MKRNCLFALLGSMGAALTAIVLLSAVRLSTAVAEGVDQGQTATAAAALSGAKSFIQRHCADCHDSTTKEAGLDLTKLPFEPEDKLNLAIWVRVHDRVGSGEMPPKTATTSGSLGVEIICHFAGIDSYRFRKRIDGARRPVGAAPAESLRI